MTKTPKTSAATLLRTDANARHVASWINTRGWSAKLTGSKITKNGRTWYRVKFADGEMVWMNWMGKVEAFL